MYDIGGLSNRSELDVETPFGAPSDKIIVGELGGARVAFLARHGAGHRLSPSELPARANIFALKTLGVRRIVSISAVGSLREEMAPRHIVAPDQLIDRTRERPSTFFGDGLVAHVGFADPFCADLRRSAVEAAASAATVHDGGNIRSHRGTAVLHARGIRDAPLLGRERRRHDGAAGSAARSRSGDVLRHARVRYGLRRLEKRRGGRVRGFGHPKPCGELSQRAPHRRAHRGDGFQKRRMRLRQRAGKRDNHKSGFDTAANAREAGAAAGQVSRLTTRSTKGEGAMPKQIPGEPYTRITVDESRRASRQRRSRFRRRAAHGRIRRWPHLQRGVHHRRRPARQSGRAAARQRPALHLRGGRAERAGVRDGGGDGIRPREALQHRRRHSPLG